jgi:hypothetical protein
MKAIPTIPSPTTTTLFFDEAERGKARPSRLSLSVISPLTPLTLGDSAILAQEKVVCRDNARVWEQTEVTEGRVEREDRHSLAIPKEGQDFTAGTTRKNPEIVSVGIFCHSSRPIPAISAQLERQEHDIVVREPAAGLSRTNH